MVVICTIPTEFPPPFPDTDDEPSVVSPGEELRLVIHVATPLAAQGETLTNNVEVVGGGAQSASVTIDNEASSDPAPSGYSFFNAIYSEADGQPATRAGSHPYQYTTSFAVNTKPCAAWRLAPFVPAGGDLKDIRVALPPGLIGDPTAASQLHRPAVQHDCIASTSTPPGAARPLHSTSAPTARRWGWSSCSSSKAAATFPVLSTTSCPRRGCRHSSASRVLGTPFYIDTGAAQRRRLRNHRLPAKTTEAKRVTAADVMVWGAPADPGHDPVRGQLPEPCRKSGPFSRRRLRRGIVAEPFLRLPTSCGATAPNADELRHLDRPSVFSVRLPLEPAPSNCAPLDFGPTISREPETTVADSPSGLRFNLHLPQNTDPDPRSGGGRPARRGGDPAEGRHGQSLPRRRPGGLLAGPARPERPAVRPIARMPPRSARWRSRRLCSTTRQRSRLRRRPERKPVQLPDLAIYIADRRPPDRHRRQARRRSRQPDPITGQLDDHLHREPAAALRRLHVEFFDGPRGAAAHPGHLRHLHHHDLTEPWSAPEPAPHATPSDSFDGHHRPGRRSLPKLRKPSPAPRPVLHGRHARPVAGAYSPFLLHLNRDDGSQNLRGLDMTLPQGLVAKLAGIPYCSEARSPPPRPPGRDAPSGNPSCPAASQVGTVTVGAGAGSSPSTSAATPTWPAPTKARRSASWSSPPRWPVPSTSARSWCGAALHVDPETAQVRRDPDPLPTILQGIPLDVRSISR